MTKRPEKKREERWHGWFLVIWLVAAAWLIIYRWNAIHWFALSDTDDNMRYAQVTAWLDGQGWYDLRQHRVDPPGGISIHWSRMVDLPIAGLILALRPFLGGAEAGRWACAIAPLLALGAALYATMLTARRLIAPGAELLAAAILFCAGSTMTMFMPLRIDHHGWQLAMLMTSVCGMADRNALRGGIVAGLSTAVSLAIGLELMPYLVTVGALTVLWWMIERDQAPRLIGYGVSIAAGSALGYALFASYDNAAPRCDALTPVYLSTLLETGALVALLGWLPLGARWERIAGGVIVALLVGGVFAYAWPACLGRPEQITPELDRIWFSHIREAKPLYEHPWRIWFPTIALSFVGVSGCALAHHAAKGSDRAMPWLLATLLSLFATLLLLWQTRAGPASQLMAVIGATALGWPAIQWTLRYGQPPTEETQEEGGSHVIGIAVGGVVIETKRRWIGEAIIGVLVRVLGTVAVFVVASGAFAGLIVKAVPERKSAFRRSVDVANRRCPTLPALKPIAALPPATILTFVDMGPRIVSVTHHSVIAGPYHRAGAEILDVQHSFRAADPEVAHAVMKRHGASLLLLCPGMSESTVYQAEAKRGFYMQLNGGTVPGWLQPVPLPEKSPFKLWRMVG